MKKYTFIIFFYLIVPSNLLGNFQSFNQNATYKRSKLLKYTNPTESELLLGKKFIIIKKHILQSKTNLAPHVYDLHHSKIFARLFPHYKESVSKLYQLSKSTSLKEQALHCKKILQKQIAHNLIKRHCVNILTEKFSTISHHQLKSDTAEQIILYWLESGSAWKAKKLLRSKFVNHQNPKLLKAVESQLSKNNEHKSKSKSSRHVSRQITLIFKRLSQDKKHVNQYTKMIHALLNYTSSSMLSNSSYINQRFLSLGKSFARRSKKEEAYMLLNHVIKHGPKDLTQEAHFQKIWIDVSKKKYSEAYYYIINHGLLKDQNHLTTKMKFWIGYTLSKLNKKNQAKLLFKDILRQTPMDYYAVISIKHLELLGESYKNVLEQLKHSIPYDRSTFHLTQLSSAQSGSLKRLRLWSILEEKTHIHDEFQLLVNDPNNSKILNDLIQLALTTLKDTTNHLFRFKLVYNEINKNNIMVDNFILKTLFPTPYLNDITQKQKTLPSELVLSLIRQESAFNPKAKSAVGATGLMQIMPSTAKGIDRNIASSMLEDPTTNLKMGSQYLAQLLDNFDDDLILSLAAYNAGGSRVNRWRKEFFLEGDSALHTIENIPFDETRNYVKLITRNIFFYQILKREDSDTHLDSRSLTGYKSVEQLIHLKH